ncbi:MAG: DMT family transporter [Thermoproteus sp.]
MDPRLSSFGKILTAAALWSTIGLASVYSGNYVILALFRSLVAASVGLALVRTARRAAVVAGLLLGVLFAVYPLAAALAGLGPAAYLLYTAPLWTAAVSAVLGERAGARDYIAVVLVSVAVALMLLEALGGSLNLWGVLAGLASGISYGSYIAVARFYSKRGEDVDVSLGAMPYTLAVTAPAALAYAAVFGLGDLWRPLLGGVYLGVFCTVLPYRLFSSGTRVVGATKASVVATLEPVLAALWGYLFLGQTPSLATALSYALITAAALLAALGE